MRLLLLFVFAALVSVDASPQGCCSGGSGSPIAGGYSQGVLREKQVEFAVNYKYQFSDKFLVGDKDTVPLFESLSSQYLYVRAGYGITYRLTMELSFGYFPDKRLAELEDRNSEDITSSGFGDFLIFPRYDVFYRATADKKTEFTIGLGYKIPIGSHSDSSVVFENPATGQKYYTVSPPTVQTTTGSQDLLIYLFGLRGYPKKNLNLFANALYIKKGFNDLGQKFGDYASVAVFASKTFFKKLGVTAQFRGEWVSTMKSARHVDQLVYYNLDPESTGSKTLYFIPQISYSYKQVTIYGLSEIPLYQYVNGVQVASGLSLTFGLSYRFSKFCSEESVLPEEIFKPVN